MAVDGVLPEGFPREKTTRIWTCRRDDASCTRTVPCVACRGARNRRSGLRKQREARKALEAVTGVQAARFAAMTSNEELWNLGVRVEVKSGAQVGPIATRFLAAEAQSAASKRIGDSRVFAMIAMPNGWANDGIFQCRISELARAVEGLLETM